MRWLLQMARWSRNPPSAGRVKFFLAVLALCLGLALAQWAGFWPDWLTVNGPTRLP